MGVCGYSEIVLPIATMLKLNCQYSGKFFFHVKCIDLIDAGRVHAILRYLGIQMIYLQVSDKCS